MQHSIKRKNAPILVNGVELVKSSSTSSIGQWNLRYLQNVDWS